MDEEKKDKKKQLNDIVKSRIKGLGLDALFHLVDVSKKDGDSTNDSTIPPILSKVKKGLTTFTSQPAVHRFKHLLKQTYTDKIFSIFGIQIETHAIKIIELKIINDQTVLTNSLFIPIPNSLCPSKEKSDLFIIDTLQQILESKDLKNNFVCSLIPRNHVIVKFLTLPTDNPEEVESMIAFEAEHHFPFPLHELEYDYQIMKQSDNKSHFLLAAIKKEEINQHIELLKKCGISADAIDISSLALFNIMAKQSSSKGITVQLNIGSDYTDINVVDDEILKYTRGVHLGIKKLISMLSKSLNVSLEIAQKIGKENGIMIRKHANSDISPQVSEISCRWADQIISEINKTIQHFQLSQGIASIEKIIITGVGSDVINLDEYIKSRFKTAVTKPKMPSDILIDSKDHSIKKNFAEMSILLGLKSRFNDTDKFSVNLLPESVKKKKTRKKKITQRVLTVSVTLILLGLSVLLPKGVLGLRTQSIKSLDNKITALQPEVATVTALEDKIQTIENYISFKRSCMDVLREITMVVSFDITIDRFSFEKNNAVVLVGEAESHSSVVNLSRAVNESKFFKDATLKYTRKKDRLKENVDFEIICTLM
jgi:type IV pilus assembly protein PilM